MRFWVNFKFFRSKILEVVKLYKNYIRNFQIHCEKRVKLFGNIIFPGYLDKGNW